MAQIKPFLGVCPREGLHERIAALPYDVYSSEEAREETWREPYSFLCIDRAETQFPEGQDMYAPEVYQRAHDLLWQMIADGRLVQEKTPCYYVYELTMDGHVQTGLVACAAVDDYVNGVIARHEATRADKEEDRVRHVDACNAQTGPIFLAYRHSDIVQRYLTKAKEYPPVFDFTSPDGIRHRGFRIDRKEDIEGISRAFEEIPQIYIADGHHRAASAVRVSLMRRAAAKEAKTEEKDPEYDYFLSVLFAQDELRILDYNRVVKDLNGHTPEEFLRLLSEKCDVLEHGELVHTCEGGVCRMERDRTPFRPAKKGEMGMYLNGTWYELRVKEAYRSEDPVEGLDVAVLQREVLSPILGIGDPRTDERISFVGGIRGLKELMLMADACGGVAFAMYPTSMEELFAVADAHRLMPPKSTWFEPKLRSGLYIHLL